MIPSTLQISLPAWVPQFVAAQGKKVEGVEDRARLAIGLAAENVRHGTGGPFGAAVFEHDTGIVVSVGVNLVVPAQCAIAHAEMLALALAQMKTGAFDLGAPGMPAHELVTSAEPCAMCFGALPWSGIARLVCAARSEDVENIGFDEGSKTASWAEQLGIRGISVLTDVCREEARAVLRRYRETGGRIYNSAKHSPRTHRS